MNFKPFNKKTKLIAVIISLLILIFIISTCFMSFKTNAEAEKQITKTYSTNEYVNLDGNFMFDSSENTDGYSINVTDYTIRNYDEYIQEIDYEKSDEFHCKYICLLTLNIKNENNEDGYINTMGMFLINGALQIPVDYEIWNKMDENIDGNIALKLRKNSETIVTIPFTPQSLDLESDTDKLNIILEKQNLNLVVSEYPIRKVIDLRNA